MRTFLLSTVLLALLALLTACGVPATSPSVSTGEQLTSPLVLRDNLGKEHDVQQILSSGKSVTLVFWQTWCRPCRAEGPALAKAARSLSDHRFFGIVSGGDDLVNQQELDSLTAELGLPYPQIRDRDGAVAERFHVLGTPTIIVLGPDGRTRYRGSRVPEDWDS